MFQTTWKWGSGGGGGPPPKKKSMGACPQQCGHSIEGCKGGLGGIPWGIGTDATVWSHFSVAPLAGLTGLKGPPPPPLVQRTGKGPKGAETTPHDRWRVAVRGASVAAPSRTAITSHAASRGARPHALLPQQDRAAVWPLPLHLIAGAGGTPALR